MARINLTIADTDDKYLSGLMKFLRSNHYEKFNINCFTNQEYLIKYIEEEKSIDILLISSNMLCKDIEKCRAKSIMVLSEKNSDGEVGGYPSIKKYQHAEKMYEDIINTYIERDPERLEIITNRNKDTKILTFYSPIGGIGKTTVSLALAEALAENNDVLYINLEDIQSTYLLFSEKKEKGFSELIYYVKERDSNLSQKFLQIRAKDEKTKVDYIPSVESLLDIDELEEEDIKFLFDNLQNMNIYNYIIVDTSSKFDLNYKTLMYMSYRVFVLLGQDTMSSFKANLFINEFENMSNFYFIVNKCFPAKNYDIPKNIERENKKIEAFISFDNSLASGEVEYDNLLQSAVLVNSTTKLMDLIKRR